MSASHKPITYEVPRIPKGFDPAGWGKPAWDKALFMAYQASLGGAHEAFWVGVYFACITRTLCCEPCRRFELHCWSVDDPASRPTSELLDWICSLRLIVSAKIHGPSALSANAPREALLRRIRATGTVGIDATSICSTLMMMALRIGTAPMSDEERSLRSEALYYMAVAVAHVACASDTLYSSLGCALLCGLHAAGSSSEEVTWADVFGAAYASEAFLVKHNGGTPRSLEESVNALTLSTPLHETIYPMSI